MKIAIIAAHGQAGQTIAKEAVKRGHQVTAIVRSENKSVAQEVIQKDAFALTKEDLAGFDVVVNAFGAWTPETLPDHARLAEHLATILAGSPTRLLVVGGAGSLYLDESQTAMLKDTPDFPAEYLPIAEAMGAGLDLYRQATAVNWTYIAQQQILMQKVKKQVPTLWLARFSKSMLKVKVILVMPTMLWLWLTLRKKVATSRNEFPYLHKNLNGLKDSSHQGIIFLFFTCI